MAYLTAGQYDITCEIGATFSRAFVWADSSGTAINITGYTAIFQVRREPGATIIHTATTENGGISISGSAGTVTVTIAAATTNAFTKGRAAYELQVTSTGGVVTRLLEGAFHIVPRLIGS